MQPSKPQQISIPTPEMIDDRVSAICKPQSFEKKSHQGTANLKGKTRTGNTIQKKTLQKGLPAQTEDRRKRQK
jgi:hypothetical protein